MTTDTLETPLEFAERLGLTFHNPSLLTRALTHRSYINEHPEALEDNERLEFLGDAILDFVVGAWLYHHLPEMPEGRLTSLRAALVRNTQLAEFARQLNLGQALRLGHGEAESGGRTRYNVLGSAFEALIGALYLDQGLEAVQTFVEPLLSEGVRLVLAENRDRDPKSLFQEHMQANGLGTPTYRIVDISGPDHERQYTVQALVNDTVYGEGTGPSKQAASKAAARDALQKLKQHSG
ncbi:MAG: ribonuclease III [Anaerolineae bacterium]|nr:MAG: ribonuclease III [Anaerolineae bacterium]